jgi:hypothetical protein
MNVSAKISKLSLARHPHTGLVSLLCKAGTRK